MAIYSSPEVIRALREFMFNDQMWPTLKTYRSQTARASIKFHALTMRSPIAIAGLKVTAFPVNHIVPTVGLLVGTRAAQWFSL